MDNSNGDENNEEVSPTIDFTNKTWRSDVTFVIGNKRLYASKCVLGMYSPVFEKMFDSDFKEREQNEIPLPDKKTEDFVEFLQCLYPKSNYTVTQANVSQVLPLAHEYQVSSLIEECQIVIKECVSSGEDILTTSDFLRCYSLVSRYGLEELESLCVDQMLSQRNTEMDLNEAKKYLPEEKVLQLQQKIILKQKERLEDVTTQFVKLFFRTRGTDIGAFENAMGAKIEQTVDDVFDPQLVEYSFDSKPVCVWNVRFNTTVSVSHKLVRGQSDKYLSIYLECKFPDDDAERTCDVIGEVHLENTSTGENKLLTSRPLGPRGFTSGSNSFGFGTFEKISKFFTATDRTVGKYSCKIVMYLLANKPTETMAE